MPLRALSASRVIELYFPFSIVAIIILSSIVFVIMNPPKLISDLKAEFYVQK